jgi:hypothetical protein
MPHEVPKQRYWANAGLLQEGNIIVSENLLRLAVASQADGSVKCWSENLRFGFTKERKIERMRKLLEGMEYEESLGSNEKNPPVTRFELSPELTKQIMDLLDDKKLPWSWLRLTPKLREAALDEAQYWDGCQIKNKRVWRFDNSDVQSVDVLQALASITERKTRKTEKPPSGRCPSKMYSLSVKDHMLTRGENVQVEEIPWEEPVACLVVPSTFVLVRDGGVPLISSNTITFGVSYGSQGASLERLGFSREQIVVFMENYFRRFKGLARYVKKVPREAERDGGLTSVFGRKRRCRVLGNRIDSAQARQMLNFPAQATAAEWVRLTYNDLCDRIRKERKRCFPINVVYDALMVEAPDEEVDWVASLYHELLEAAVPELGGRRYTIDVGVGQDWALAEKDSKKKDGESAIKPVSAQRAIEV